MDGAISNAKRLYAPVIIDYYHCGTVCLPKTRTFGVSVVGGTEDVPDTAHRKSCARPSTPSCCG